MLVGSPDGAGRPLACLHGVLRGHRNGRQGHRRRRRGDHRARWRALAAGSPSDGWCRTPDTYRLFRGQLGRAILVGLELLVAADIIRTVAVTPTLESVAVLAGIVVIRTFLSWSLELEISGRWPWQTRRS